MRFVLYSSSGWRKSEKPKEAYSVPYTKQLRDGSTFSDAHLCIDIADFDALRVFLDTYETDIVMTSNAYPEVDATMSIEVYDYYRE